MNGRLENILLNSLPHSKILDLTKFKAFADDKINVAHLMICHFDIVENIVGKRENGGLAFSPFLTVFSI